MARNDTFGYFDGLPLVSGLFQLSRTLNMTWSERCWLNLLRCVSWGVDDLVYLAFVCGMFRLVGWTSIGGGEMEYLELFLTVLPVRLGGAYTIVFFTGV